MKYSEELLEFPENTLKSSLIPFVAIPILFTTIVFNISKAVIGQTTSKK